MVPFLAAVPALIGGLQKYFIVALVAFGLIATSASLYYRSSYHAEYASRVQIEQRLSETVKAFDALRAAHQAQLDALSRAEAEARRNAEQRRTTRERVINVPSDQDGPVSPVLRCAIAGVC